VTGGQCAQVRPELGVYLLGAIEPAQRTLVDHHLAACPRCRAELSDLAGLPSLLRRVPADAVGQLRPDDADGVTPGPPLSVLLGRIAVIRRRRRILALAAAVLAGIAAASGVQVLHAATRPPTAAVTAWAVTVHGINPVTGAWAAVRYTGQPWGTELEVSVTGIAVGTRCQLIVTGPGGQKAVAGGWELAAGQQPTWYMASAPFRAASLGSFEITADRKVLVTIPAR
jgi:anti-sigma factor RsiW